MRASVCPSSILNDCSPATCHWRCALEVVDELLTRPVDVSPEEMDLLLDFRWKLRQYADAEGVLRFFCDLRRRMEQRHYLAFFRMRRWLENHMVAIVQPDPDSQPRQIQVKLNHFCVEAIRRFCLCAALQQNARLSRPRVRFAFFNLPPNSAPDSSQEILRAESVA